MEEEEILKQIEFLQNQLQEEKKKKQSIAMEKARLAKRKKQAEEEKRQKTLQQNAKAEIIQQKQLREKEQEKEESREMKILQKLKEAKISLDNAEAEMPQKPSIMDAMSEKLLVIGTFMFCILSALSIVWFLYAMFKGFKFEGYMFVLVGIIFVAAVGVIVSVALLFSSGIWWRIGWALKRKKGDLWVKFTKSRKLLFKVEKRGQMQYFWPRNKESMFFSVTKGYLEPSTSATVRTVREGALTDFDVDEEYKTDLEDLGPMVANRHLQQWDAALLWGKTKKDWLQLLVIIAIFIGVGTLIAVGASYIQLDTANQALQTANDNFQALQTQINELKTQAQAFVDSGGSVIVQSGG